MVSYSVKCSVRLQKHIIDEDAINLLPLYLTFKYKPHSEVQLRLDLKSVTLYLNDLFNLFHKIKFHLI